MVCKGLITLLILSSFFVIYVSIFSFSTILMNDNRNVNRKKVDEDFIYTHYDSVKNTTSRGFVPSLNIFQDGNDFMSYETTEGQFALISKQGFTEYVCRGSCYCDEEYDEFADGDRRKGNIFSGKGTAFKGLFFLVASLSSVLAYDLARKHFQDVCVEYSATCSSNRILSEVDVCEEILPDSNPDNIKNFRCKGNCVQKTFFQHGYKLGSGKDGMSNTQKELIAKGYNCQGLKQEGEIELDFTVNLDVLPRYPNAKYFENRARKVFIKNFLKDFCERNSMIFYNMKTEKIEEDMNVVSGSLKAKGDKSIVAITCCKPLVALTKTNPSVKCVEI